MVGGPRDGTLRGRLTGRHRARYPLRTGTGLTDCCQFSVIRAISTLSAPWQLHCPKWNSQLRAPGDEKGKKETCRLRSSAARLGDRSRPENREPRSRRERCQPSRLRGGANRTLARRNSKHRQYNTWATSTINAHYPNRFRERSRPGWRWVRSEHGPPRRQ
jgi:hypothetical protein